MFVLFLIFEAYASQKIHFHVIFSAYHEFKQCEEAAVGTCEMQRQRVDSVYSESEDLRTSVESVERSGRC